jgi:ubiquinone/menaquinone biosynthesis C-methylase UbiE
MQMQVIDPRQRFTGRVDDYEKYRQRYPAEEVIAQLREWCGLDGSWFVADIGAGTGMLTEVFLGNGNRVIAIEPNAEMRSVCEGLREEWPELEVVDATAEHTTLADGSVDMVAAGRAFHWFDRERALSEFRRVLKPGGWVALVAAGRAPDDSEQVKEFERLLMDHSKDYSYVRAGYRVHEQMDEIFPIDLHQAQIQGEQCLNWGQFRGQMLSLSVTPHPSDEGFDEFERDLRGYFDRFATEGVITMPTTCWITVGRLG